MQWLVKMLTSEGEAYPSSKRVITFMAFVLIAIGFLSELFLARTVSPTTFEAVMYIVLGGLGFTASEKFSKKDTTK